MTIDFSAKSKTLRAQDSRWALFFIAWLALSLISSLWSVTTPISGAPDEPAHLIKAAAVARGQILGANTDIGQRVTVPAYIAYTSNQACFAFKNEVTADCAVPLAKATDNPVISTTPAGLYNPTYYVLVGWPSLLFPDQLGIYAMRIFSGIVCSAFLAVAFMLLSTWRRRTLPMIGFAVALTPMVFFLNGVVNPNSLETAATLASFVGVLSIVLHPVRRYMLERSLVVLISAAIAVNTRGLSPIWVAVAVLSPLVLLQKKELLTLLRPTVVRVTVLGVAIATAAAIAWTVASKSLVAGMSAPGQSAGLSDSRTSPIRGFIEILSGTFDYGQGIVGFFGWLDSPAPLGVFFVWAVFIGGMIVAALTLLRGRQLVLAVLLVVGLVFIPPLVQAAYVSGGGIIWQGRYALPLFACVCVGLFAVLSERLRLEPSSNLRRFAVVFAIAWSASQIASVIVTLKRYSVGTTGHDATWARVFLDPSWNPPGGTILLSAITVILFAACSALLVWVAFAPCRLQHVAQI